MPANYINFDLPQTSSPIGAASDSGDHYRQLLAQLLSQRGETNQGGNSALNSLPEIVRMMQMRKGAKQGSWFNPDTGVVQRYGGSSFGGGLFGGGG
jgi:hypothetical protein